MFSYFLNEISFNKKATPYSFAAGVEDMIVPEDLAENEVVVNNSKSINQIVDEIALLFKQ